MSFTELKEKVADLNAAELEELRQLIADRTRPPVRRATPEMLAERRRLSDEIMRGEWNAELPGYEESREKDRGKNEELFAATPEMLTRRREISQKFLSGEWSVDLPTYEEIKAEARRKDPWI